jgi:DNA-binding SARP family transcriptional activator
MFRLRLFGGASLEREDGGPLVGRAAQRQRVALLARLARAPASGVSRDKVLALFWPESDTERARNRLNVSIYELRKALGEEAILSRGDDLLLNADVLRADVVEFDAAIGRGAHEAAAGLYRGPFLDGFFLPDAPEFERWSGAERDRLAGDYARTLEALAESAERRRDFHVAAEWWRKRVGHDPYDSRVSMRLMAALDAGGNRAAALQHASLHERLLQEEVGLRSPSPVAALAERLRSEPMRANAPQIQPSPPMSAELVPSDAAALAVPAASSSGAGI